MKERVFQSWIIAVAEQFGWSVYHVPAPMRPIGGGRFVPEPRAAGLPDLLMLHADPPRLIFAEVKGQGGRLSAEQTEFLRLARAVASSVREIALASDTSAAVLGVYTWRPGQEDLIEAVLRGKVMVA